MKRPGNEADRVRERPNHPKEVMAAFREGTGIDRALRQAVREALARHKLLGHYVVVVEGDMVRLIPPDQIRIEP